MVKQDTKSTQEFYDDYWPRSVPTLGKTIEHVESVLPNLKFNSALDAGCGTGVCTVALSKKAKEATGIDVSSGSLETAKQLSKDLNINNTNYVQGSLLSLPFDDSTFDLVWSWGVIHHTEDPNKSFNELVRVLKKDGCIVLAVYRKTIFSSFHEFVRKRCLKMNEKKKKRFISFVDKVVSITKLNKRTPSRDDNEGVAVKIEDWYFVPIKHFYSINDLKKLFKSHNISLEILDTYTGRLKSTSNIIVRGVKQ